MTTNIEITHAQATALASLTESQGPLALRQLAAVENAKPDDLYVTPRGSAKGYRIAPDGALSEIGETLPVPD